MSELKKLNLKKTGRTTVKRFLIVRGIRSGFHWITIAQDEQAAANTVSGEKDPDDYEVYEIELPIILKSESHEK